MNVYYSPAITIGSFADKDNVNCHGIDLLSYDLERLKPQHGLNVCPASSHFVSKFFLVRSPVEFTVHHDGNSVWAEGMDKEQFEALFRVRWESSNEEFAWLNVCAGTVFAAEKTCLLETYPAFLHGNPYEVALGSFDISKWQRPADFTFKVYKGTTVTVKRGDPLYYVAFKTPVVSEPIKLIKTDLEEFNEAVKSCLAVKHFMKKVSWEIANGTGNKWKKRKRCPFSFITKIFNRK